MLPSLFRRLPARLLPLIALAILSANAATTASAQTCPTVDCTILPAGTLRPQQLIQNGGFDNGMTGWTLNGGGTVGSTIVHCGSASLGLRTYYIGGSNVFWPD